MTPAKLSSGALHLIDAHTSSHGSQGKTGPAGTAGATGAQGPVGAVGAQGPSGATGAQGPVGAVGAQGPSGATGAQGPVGATGPRGPSDVYSSDGTLQLTALPAGNYQLQATLTYGGGTGAGAVDCQLVSTPTGQHEYTMLDETALQATGDDESLAIPLQAVGQFTTTVDVSVSCTVSTGGGSFGNGTAGTFGTPQLTALQVATIH